MRTKAEIIKWVQEQRSSSAEMLAIIELLPDLRDKVEILDV